MIFFFSHWRCYGVKSANFYSFKRSKRKKSHQKISKMLLGPKNRVLEHDPGNSSKSLLKVARGNRRQNVEAFIDFYGFNKCLFYDIGKSTTIEMMTEIAERANYLINIRSCVKSWEMSNFFSFRPFNIIIITVVMTLPSGLGNGI